MPLFPSPMPLPELTISHNRGSSFLKKWMDFLEEHADLRYPDSSTVNL